ncbi:N-acetyl-gamma-glutamyl-phosphate reductase [Litorimonas taeanensis]|uniref:N-acetyl-gamma-glutamyl-phosphate reductase n=1 Tax=Litorimonas taeanensis TaxID=568099 RepID=A0A420WKI7_9PROT|nr:N-acetyl-gamma-glutamyl-phosphate reductase [Litorimonas taeanensis]RKQ71415.1 N-acetyl-gamma-glutamyl-phosphate reductase [Litorimonas taeanensis]
MSTSKKAAVLGASGYTGVEVIRLIQNHPKIEVAALTGHSRAGERAGDVFANISHLNLPDLQDWNDVDWSNIDVAFACLPHGASQETIAQILPKVETVIDLSADFRLRDPELYAATYGRPHNFTSLLDEAVYGLSEWAIEDLKGAELVACPGCFPTCSLLPLLPLLEKDLIDAKSLPISAITGVTGAGRKATLGLSFTELAEGAQAYGVGAHRHAPEIDQIIKRISGQDSCVTMTPHLVPLNRGMITTTVVTLRAGKTVADLRNAMLARYTNSSFISVLDEGEVPQTRHVRGSNRCHMNVFDNRTPNTAIVVAVIDNLTKGSSGQALQNYNLSQGWDETLGLTGLALFP